LLSPVGAATCATGIRRSRGVGVDLVSQRKSQINTEYRCETQDVTENVGQLMPHLLRAAGRS
jgi:hypothetical protein